MIIKDMFSLDDFIKTNTDKKVEREDPSNLYQCLDLAFAYVDELGIPRETIRHLYAYQTVTEPTASTLAYFDIVKNTPEAVPIKGDLMVWGTGVGKAGHISIFVNGDVNGFTSFDQNWPVGSTCHLQAHNYTLGPVLGWLHPKAVQPTTVDYRALLLEMHNLVNPPTDSIPGPLIGKWRIRQVLAKAGL